MPMKLPEVPPVSTKNAPGRWRFAVDWVETPSDQLNKRGLTRSVGPNYSEVFAFADRERKIMENKRARIVDIGASNLNDRDSGFKTHSIKAGQVHMITIH